MSNDIRRLTVPEVLVTQVEMTTTETSISDPVKEEIVLVVNQIETNEGKTSIHL